MDGPMTRLQLRVSPGSSGTGVVGRYGAGWKVRVASPPERGRANRAVLDLLAETLDVPRTRLELLSGHGGRDKVVAVGGLSAAEAERRLAGAMVVAP
jgi:uncharacterized protein YggU (UPF0235/DUF167 family)